MTKAVFRPPFGVPRFADFRQQLDIASDVLADRLAALVERGLLERVAYRENGGRSRAEYVLTDAGRDFQLVLAALGTWGRQHLTTDADAGVSFEDPEGRPVRVAFVDDDGRSVGVDEVSLSRSRPSP